ncbi:KAP family P-loop NTPase fold protein [Endothiovibrio diazotrophicus]
MGGLFGDNPIGEMDEDRLGRRGLAEGLVELLQDADLDLPLTAAIYGDWGSGKSSFLNMLRSGISADHITVDFEAWAYGGQSEALWRALFLVIVERLREWTDRDGVVLGGEARRKEYLARLDDLVERLYRSRVVVERGETHLNWSAALPLLSRGAIRAASLFLPGLDLAEKTLEAIRQELGSGRDAKDVAELLRREELERYREQITSLEQFRRELRAVVEEFVTGSGRRIIVFIDDLDRCLPEVAVSALEGIKVFLDMPGTLFVLAVDRRLIEHGVEVRYRALLGGSSDGAFNARDYLDKIIQLPIDLPPPSEAHLRAFVEQWRERHGDARLTACGEVIWRGSPSNPRALKRTLNLFSFASRLIPSLMPDVREDDHIRLAKLTVLQVSYRDLYRRVIEEPSVLAGWERGAQLGRTDELSESLDARVMEMLRQTGGAFGDAIPDRVASLIQLTGGLSMERL